MVLRGCVAIALLFVVSSFIFRPTSLVQKLPYMAGETDWRQMIPVAETDVSFFSLSLPGIFVFVLRTLLYYSVPNLRDVLVSHKI